MERLVKGIIKNLLIEYIEYTDSTYHNRKQTTIKKKTSFSINDEIFYTFEDLETVEGKEEIFHANEKKQITLFGKEQIIEDLEKVNKIKANRKKEEITDSVLFTFLSTLIFSGLIIIKMSTLNNDIPIVVNIFVYSIIAITFLVSFIGCFFIKEEIEDLKKIKKVIKEEESYLFDEGSSCSISIIKNEKIDKILN